METMKTCQRKKQLILLAAILILGLLALLTQRGILPFKKFTAGGEREEGNEIQVTSVDQEIPFVNNGNCTLGEAFKAASENVVVDACVGGVTNQPDVIILGENATYSLLRAPFVDRDNRDGLRALQQRRDGGIIVQGNGATIERGEGAEGNFRLLRSSGRLTLRQITFQGGKLSDADLSPSGGGLYHSGNLTIQDALFRNNEAKFGGALFLESATPQAEDYHSAVLEDCLFLENVAWFGGAIYYSGHATIRSSRFMNNSVSKDGGAISVGAPIVLKEGQVLLPARPVTTISDSFFRNNRAVKRGGAIQIAGRMVDRGNTVRWEPDVTVERTTLSENQARYGGAISNSGRVYLYSSAISDNVAEVSGGGIISASGFYAPEPGLANNMVQLYNTTVGRNSARELGGAILATAESPLMIYNSTLFNNSTSDDQADGLASGSTSLFQNTILAGNGDGDCRKTGDGFLFSSRGNNLLGVIGNCEVRRGQGVPDDIVRADPLLGELRGNQDDLAGNEHFPLLAESPAINAGADPELEDLEQDQLGRERIDEYDIGAVEAVCGDGIGHARIDEECDDGNDVNTDGCLNDCREARCGDNLVQAGIELCDDGNNADGDECPANCRRAECGDGILQANLGEQCDDGNRVNSDVCLNNCLTAVCGDGLVQQGIEECDDANPINDDACNNNCVAGRCGDGLKQENEECDDGNQVADDACRNDCKILVAILPPPLSNLPRF